MVSSLKNIKIQATLERGYSNKYIIRKEENVLTEDTGELNLKLGKGEKNIGKAVQGRGLKCKNIGFKKKARRKLHNRAEGGKIKSQRREEKK